MKHWEDCTKREKIARWENAVRVLRGLSPHERRRHWDMGTFGKKTDCGTIACAAGHCGMDYWFIRRGLKLTFDQEGEGEFDHYLAVIRFFGKRGADKIFYNISNRPVGKVIREINQFIRFLKKTPPREINELTDSPDYTYENLAA